MLNKSSADLICKNCKYDNSQSKTRMMNLNNERYCMKCGIKFEPQINRGA